jgi:hypothetical protein
LFTHAAPRINWRAPWVGEERLTPAAVILLCDGSRMARKELGIGAVFGFVRNEFLNGEL